MLVIGAPLFVYSLHDYIIYMKARGFTYEDIRREYEREVERKRQQR